MFSQVSISHSVHRVGGGCLADPQGRHSSGRHSLDRHTPFWADTPLPSACWDTHPPTQCMLGYTPLPSAADSTHPTGMHSCYHNSINFPAVSPLHGHVMKQLLPSQGKTIRWYVQYPYLVVFRGHLFRVKMLDIDHKSKVLLQLEPSSVSANKMWPLKRWSRP